MADEQTQDPAGDPPGESQTQPQQQTPPATQQQQQQQRPAVPAGYVPVSEVSKERSKTKEVADKLAESQQKVTQYEHKEAKHGFLNEALGTLGENFRIEDQAGLTAVVDALNFDSANPDATKGVITKLVETAKRPVRATPTTPMFGKSQTDQNKPAEGQESGRYAAWEKMQARRKSAA